MIEVYDTLLRAVAEQVDEAQKALTDHKCATHEIYIERFARLQECRRLHSWAEAMRLKEMTEDEDDRD